MNSNTLNQHRKFEAIMMSLLKDLETLAPHPDRPDYKGPVLVQINPDIRPPAEYEGMMGSMLLDGMLGSAFSEVASIDWSNAMDMADTYMQDRSANNNYRLGQRNAISGAFNTGAAKGELMKAWLADLPRRQALELSLAHYQRLIYSLQKQARTYGLPYAA